MFGGFDLSKHWQAQKKPSTISQNIGRHQKKQKKTQSQRLLRTLDPHRLEICVFFVFFGACQCFVRLCLVFFCVCAGLMSLLGVEKERQYLHCLLCSFSFKNHVPMVPKTVGKSCFAKWPFRSSLAVLG